MLDDLRDSAVFEEEDNDENDYEYQEVPPSTTEPSQFLGMTPIQRFVIAFLIFMMVCILGSFFLLVTGTIWLPF